MKKILMIALALGVTASVNAQSNEQMQNKNGVDIMPVKGEFAIGLGTNLSTFTGFVGNMFGGFTGSNDLGNSTYLTNPGGTTVAIFGKYMTSDSSAIRLSFHVYGEDIIDKYEAYDDLVNNPDSMVIDSRRFNESSNYISLGLEWRRGKSRLRGFYGGDAVLSWTNEHTHYNYGNDITATNVTPTTSASLGNVWNPDFGRITEERTGAIFGIGVRGFVGVEYFIAPKICVGTEFGWTAMMSHNSKSTTSYEEYDAFMDNGDGTFGAIRTKIIEETLGSRKLSTSIDNFNSQFYFHFYF
tara:strand:- start:1574 stop:2467 length:894 start_codon:yes stop_codon:yes gene_type:complete